MRKSKTPEQFVSEVFELVGNEYEVLENYKGAATKVKMKHKECGNEYSVKPTHFISSSSRCPKCASGGIKKPHEKFVEEVHELVGDEYTVSNKYKSSAHKVIMLHKGCGNKYKVSPAHFLNGTRCPDCVKGGRKKTHNEFVNEVYQLVSGKYTVLGEYKNSDSKIKMKHEVCKNEWDVNIRSFIWGGSRCPKCATNRKKTPEEFIEEVYNLVEKNYTVLGKYEGALMELKIRHEECGHEYETRPSYFLKGIRCPKCSLESKSFTQEEFITKVKEVHGDEFKVIGEYKNSQSKVKMKHLVCQHEYNPVANNVVNGLGCPRCAIETSRLLRSTSNDDYVKRVLEQGEGEYEPLEMYFSTHKPILMRHKVCGHEWDVRPSSFFVGSRCPKCNSSKGEKKVAKYLDRNLYSYKIEYRINECRDIIPLPFDVAVFNESSLMCLIEYEGEQHYEPVKNWGGEEGLRGVQYRDQIKRDYCKDNGIPLIEIPYWEQDNIELILDTELNKIEMKLAPIKLEVGKKESILL